MAYQILNWDKSVKEEITDEKALDILQNPENYEGHYVEFGDDIWNQFQIDKDSQTLVLKKVE